MSPSTRSQFISKLHETLERAQYPDDLRWLSNDTFEITCDDHRARIALSPSYDFRSLSSFIRQLSYYGFKRLSDRRRSVERRAGSTSFIVFTHPSGNFLRDDKSTLGNISRKTRTRRTKGDGQVDRSRKLSVASDSSEPSGSGPPAPLIDDPERRRHEGPSFRDYRLQWQQLPALTTNAPTKSDGPYGDSSEAHMHAWHARSQPLPSPLQGPPLPSPLSGPSSYSSNGSYFHHSATPAHSGYFYQNPPQAYHTYSHPDAEPRLDLPGLGTVVAPPSPTASREARSASPPVAAYASHERRPYFPPAPPSTSMQRHDPPIDRNIPHHHSYPLPNSAYYQVYHPDPVVGHYPMPAQYNQP